MHVEGGHPSPVHACRGWTSLTRACYIPHHTRLAHPGLPWESESNKNSFSEFLDILHRMFFRPAFMTFGELFVDQIADDSAWCGNFDIVVGPKSGFISSVPHYYRTTRHVRRVLCSI